MKQKRVKKGLVLVLICVLLSAVLSLTVFAAPNVASGTTFEVINTNDSDAGSLRQAILDANALPGHDTIGFTIPGPGVHVIALQTVLPPVTDPVNIDGSSQPGYVSGSPVVELSGSEMNLDFPDCKGPALGRYRDHAGFDVRMDPGTNIDASGTTILGFKISHFCQGISVSGEVGPREDGTAYGCTSGGAKIAGVTVKDNVILDNDQGNAALDLCNATESLVQGNFLNNQTDNIEVAHSNHVIVSDNTALNGKDGVSLVTSNFITIQGNEFNGTSTGIHMKFNAADNTVIDNVMTDVKRFGLALSDNNLVTGNTITGSGWFGIEIRGGSSNIVENNRLIGNGFSHVEPIFAGIVVGIGSRRALGVDCSVNEIGEPSNCDEDAEWNPWRQAGSFDNIVRGNVIANNNGPGILVGGKFNEWVPGLDHTTWDPVSKGFIGEMLFFSENNSLLDNAIYGNLGPGIDLSDEAQYLYHDLPEPFPEHYVEIQDAAPDGPTPNDSLLLANGGQNAPVLNSATKPASQARAAVVFVQGTLDAEPSARYRISLYANSEPSEIMVANQPTLSWQGEKPLGSRIVRTNQDGHVGFKIGIRSSALPACSLTLLDAENADGCITGTATELLRSAMDAGSTSEFSNMVTFTAD